MNGLLFAAAMKIATEKHMNPNAVALAAINAAKGEDYSAFAKLLPETDISVSARAFPAGLIYLETTDISVGGFARRSAHDSGSKGVRRARANGHFADVVKEVAK